MMFVFFKILDYDHAKGFARERGTVTNPTGPTKEQMSRIYRLYTTGQLNKKDNNPIDSE
jgi:hypothetical protein